MAALLAKLFQHHEQLLCVNRIEQRRKLRSVCSIIVLNSVYRIENRRKIICFQHHGQRLNAVLMHVVALLK